MAELGDTEKQVVEEDDSSTAGEHMIPEPQRNVVYISDLLPERHPDVAAGLETALAAHAIPLRQIGQTRDIWCRDYMPVQVRPGQFVRFRYSPDYLRGHEHLITESWEVGPEINPPSVSAIVLDGGNLVGWGDRCIITEKLFRENRGIERTELLNTLSDLLGVDEIVVIPVEPGDVVGHADGVVRFLRDRLVAINDYSDVAPRYGKRLVSILRRAGLELVQLPYRPVESVGEIPSAAGGYANFLMVRGLVVLPAYQLPEDELALHILERYTGMPILPLGCNALAAEGGVLNCVTWTILADQTSEVALLEGRSVTGL